MKERSGANKALLAVSAAAVMAVGLFAQAFAASTVTVLPSTSGWSKGESLGAGEVNFVTDATSPLPDGALQLKTGESSGDKANYSLATVTNLSSITELSYSTKQVASSFEAGNASYQLSTCFYGVTDTGCVASTDGTPSWANLVFEPYVSEGNAAVKNGVWQTWNVAEGNLYATRNIGEGTNLSGYQTFTLSQLQERFPNAVVVGAALNVGRGNLNYDIHVDAMNFNGTVYDFQTEPVVVDTAAPVVTITSPTDGAMVQGDDNLAATITDDTALLRYYYFVSGPSGRVVGPVTVSTSDAQVYFSRTVDTTAWADGVYTFQVEARDAAGNKDDGPGGVSVQKVTFTVNNVVDTKEQCKADGWRTLLRADRSSFKNQGQCVAYNVANEKSRLLR